MRLLLVINLFFFIHFAFAQKQVNMSFDLSTEPVVYKHYWKSTGYSPAWMTLNEDYRLYLNMLKAMKVQAVAYTRPHYLLNHVIIHNPGTPNQSYDWTELDEILDLITEANLKLIFEIMMVPHPYFNNWYDRQKLDAWNKLCYDLIRHLQKRYGKEKVRSWYFESTNEPDGGHWWPYGPLEFLYYYDATAAGIKRADPELRFGGPGNSRGLNTIYEVFIQHVYDDFNFYTQDYGVVADFITWHRKDTPHDMIEIENELNRYLKRKKFRDNPQLIHTPIGNDEADPLAGWGRPFWWRPSPWYGAFVAQSIDLHNQFFIDSLKQDYFVLSNDNAFMGDWYRRTHVARFIPGDNSIMQKRSSTSGGSWARGTDERPETESFYLIKKQDMTVMSLLALQGNKRFLPSVLEKDSTAGVIVSKNDLGEYFILTYNKPEIEVDRNKQNKVAPKKEAIRYQSQSKSLNIKLNAVPKGQYTILQYKIDEKHGNPYKTWQELGSPEDPSTQEILKIQATEDPALIRNENINIRDAYTITDVYKNAGITLTMLAKKSKTKPEPILNFEYHSYQGLNAEKMIMFNWSHSNDAHIQSYDVFYSQTKSGEYNKINEYDVFEPGFLYIDGKNGFYKVQALDYWNRKSNFSTTLEVK